MLSNIETWYVICALIVVRSVICIQKMFWMSTILAYAGQNTAGKIVNCVVACRSANCSRLSFNVIHQLLQSGWTVWAYLKVWVSQDRPATVKELMDNVGRETWAVDTATGRRVIYTFACRVMACIHQNGGHLEHILDAYPWSDHNECVFNVSSLYVT